MTLLGVFKEAMRVGFCNTKFTVDDDLFDELTDVREEILLLQSQEYCDKHRPRVRKPDSCAPTSCHEGIIYNEELDAHFNVFVQKYDSHYDLECKWIILPGKYKWQDAIAKIDSFSKTTLKEVAKSNVANCDRLVAVLIIDDAPYLSDCDHQECLMKYRQSKGESVASISSSETHRMKETGIAYGYDVFDTGDGYYLLAHNKETLQSTLGWAQKYAAENKCKLGYFTGRYDCTLVEICK